MPNSWDETFSSGREFPPLNRLFLKKLLSAVSPNPKTALDLGCGTGDDLVLLASAGLAVKGVDGSAVAIKKAKTKTAGRGIELIEHDLETLTAADLQNRNFDIVLCKLTIAFITDRERFLGLMAEFLSPAGTFVLITPVVYAGETYAEPRVKKISVEFNETLSLLKRHFKTVSVFQEDFAGAEEVKIAFLARN